MAEVRARTLGAYRLSTRFWSQIPVGLDGWFPAITTDSGQLQGPLTALPFVVIEFRSPRLP